MQRKATSSNVERFLQRRMRDGNISSTALVFTLFCDVVTQHGGEIWLGSVIHALAPLGISERLTRTAVFRLVQDGWLESDKQGRRSYYRLTRTGQHYYQRAAKRIYASGQPAWDGVWTLLFASLVPKEKRDALRKGLLWQGYGSLAPGVFALPSFDRQALHELLQDLQLEDSIVRMQAQTAKHNHPQNMQKLVMARWDLENLRQRFAEFNQHYSGVLKILQQSKQLSGHSLFLLRILLIQEYRRVLLHDPELPTAMMPANWEGNTAQSLAATIYRWVATPSVDWANRELVNTKGALKGGSEVLQTRFNTNG